MNKYLTPKKVLIDSAAIYKSHFLYMTVLVAAVHIPNYYAGTLKEESELLTLLMPISIFLNVLVDMLLIKLASTSYIHHEFNISDDIKSSLKKILPYTVINFVGGFVAILGFSFLIFPGIIAMLILFLVKVDYVNNGKLINKSFSSVITLLKGRRLIKAIQINMIPVTGILLLSIILNMFIKIETLEADLEKFRLHITIGSIIILPLLVCFYTSLYFNLVKENQLDSTD